MKFTIILAISLMFNLKRLKAENITWTKLIADIEQYPIDTLQILNIKKEAKNVKVYIKIDSDDQIVTLYLFLPEADAATFGLPLSLQKSFSNQKAHAIEFNMAYTNSFLRSYYKLGKDGEADFFYHLKSTRHCSDAQCVRDFEEKEHYDFHDEDVYSIAKQVRAFISGVRNKRLGELYSESSQSPELNKLFEMISLLHLTNNNSMEVSDIAQKFNELIERFSKDFGLAPNPIWQNLKPLQAEFRSYFDFHQDYKQSEVGAANEKIDKIINKSIKTFSDIVTKEFSSVNKFQYGGLRGLFEKYLNSKYVNYASNRLFFDSVMDFVERIMKNQMLYLGYNNDWELHCDEKIYFFDELKTRKIGKHSFENIRLNTQAIESNQFLVYKTQFEEYVKSRFERDTIAYLGIGKLNQILDIENGGGTHKFFLTGMFEYEVGYRKEGSVPQSHCEYHPKKRKLRRLKN
jgi:hypothetical protein